MYTILFKCKENYCYVECLFPKFNCQKQSIREPSRSSIEQNQIKQKPKRKTLTKNCT